MNLVDAYVTEILSKPYHKYGKWFVDIKCNSYGKECEKSLMFKSKKKAESIEIGYKFQT